MSWLGGSLSSLTGHLQNLTKEVLSEPKENEEVIAVELRTFREKIEELEATCAAQKLEIAVLTKQNADLLLRLYNGGLVDEVEGPGAAAAAASTATSEWLSGEHCSDANLGRHDEAISDPGYETKWQSEHEEEEQLTEYLQTHMHTVEKEKYKHALGELEAVSPQELLSENKLLKNRLKEINGKVTDLENKLQKEHSHCLKHVVDSQGYLSKEREKMELLVQDLTASVASLQGDKKGLQASLEELDKQHQAAVDQLLDLRRAEQVEKDLLKLQLEELKRTEQTETIEFSEATVQTFFSVFTEAATQTELLTSQGDGFQEELLLKHSKELCEKMRKMINFDLSYEDDKSDPLQVVEKMVKLCNEWKWKKNTLERKLSELMREYGDAKDTITVLEEECSSLRENIEQLAEQLVGINKNDKQSLPTIHENSEEAEAIEQKVVMLEAQVEVLNETRENLEADASKMKERCQELQSKVKSLEAQLRNQENLETEVLHLRESLTALKAELQEVHALKTAFQNTAECLQLELKESENKVEEMGKLERYCVKAWQEVHEVEEGMEELKIERNHNEEMKCLSQTFKRLQDETQVQTLNKELENSSEEVEQVHTDLKQKQNNNCPHTDKYQDISGRLREPLSLCQTQSDLGPEMADLEQKLEKRSLISKEGCVHELSDTGEALQEECIRFKSDMVKHEGKSKEAEKWKEKLEIAERDLQLISEEREALQVETNRLNFSNVSFQQQIELLQRKICMFENERSLSSQETKNVKENVLFLEKETIKSGDSDKVSMGFTEDLTMNKFQKEHQRPLKLEEETTKEINLLNSKIEHLSAIIEENLATIFELEQTKVKLIDQALGNEKELDMMRETIAKLSDMMMRKEQEYFEAREQGRLELATAQGAAAQAINERDQLVQTVQVKHQESLQYHAEIQRLTAVLTQEMQKYEETVMQYTTMVQKLEEQKNTVETSEEVQQLQLLMGERDEVLRQCSKQLRTKEVELQTCHVELEALRQQVDSVTLRGRPDGGMDVQEEDIHEKYSAMASMLNEEQKKNKKLLSEVDLHQVKEASLQREVERLRLHLIEIVEMHTRETLHLEESIKDLQSKLQQAEEHVKSSSTLYKSASIRANQQVETLQEQARLIAQQRDEVQEKLSLAEDQVAKHSAALCNLQAVLEQFQRDKEREVAAATAVVHLQVDAVQKRFNDLLTEIASLKLQLNEAKEGLSAASRLGEQLEMKATLIAALKKEVADLQEKLKKAEYDAQSVMHVIEGKIDKSLAKNVVLGYFFAPPNSKEQVLHIVASVLDFSEMERKQVQQKLGFHDPSATSGRWFKNLLHFSEANDDNNQSLSEAFVRFLENESIPHPKLRMLPEAEEQSSSSSNTSSSESQRRSPLVLPDVQLPTFVHVGRNSSTILKDILKES